MLGTNIICRAYRDRLASAAAWPLALCPRNLGCPPWTPRRTEGQQPQSSAQAGIAQVRRDASRLHHSVGIQRGYLCSGDASWLPLHSQGYIMVASARPHTALYAVPFSSFKQSGDASRVPPRMGGCIVDASAVQGTAFLTNKNKRPPHWRKRSVLWSRPVPAASKRATVT